MRLVTLSLRAFGPLSGVELDLSAAPAVHVIYGPNEAGKSTALRAITGLLYGIPHLSPDAHTHRPEDLRIGGTLVSRAGAELRVVRRKGRVRTLLDEDGAPLPEHALLPFLGGIGEDVFRAAFGLDHETLRLGAQALLEGRGHLGESLFGAGLGGTGITNVLDALRKEADELFSPLARTRKLNAAIRAVVEAKKRAQAAAMPASAWLTQEQAIREAHEGRAALDEEAQRLRTEERRLRRARTLVGLLAQLRAARDARAALGLVTLLPDDAAAERALAESEIDAASAQIRRAEEALARLAEQRAALSIPFALVAQADAVEDVATRLGSHRKAAIDLPRVRAELRGQEEEAAEIARALGVAIGAPAPAPAAPVPAPTASPAPAPAAPTASFAPTASPAPGSFGGVRAELERLRVDAARDERLRALARDAPALVERVRHAEEELARVEGELTFLHVRAAALPGPRDLAPLRRAEARAKGLGDVAAALDKAARAEALLGERAAAARAALGLDDVPLAAVARLPVPLPETLDLFAAEDRGLRAERASLAARSDEARAALARADVALVELAAGDLPTEADLVAARAARAAALLDARAALARIAHEDAAHTHRGQPGPARTAASDEGAPPQSAQPVFFRSTAGDEGAPLLRAQPGLARAAAGDEGAPPPRAQPVFVRAAAADAARALTELARAIDTADRAADRLRAEADRVAQRARLAAEREAHATVLAALKREAHDLDARAAALDARWRDLWSPAAIDPRSPDEMRGWLRRHEALVALVDQVAAARAEREALAAQADACAAELAAVLGEAAAAHAPALAAGLRDPAAHRRPPPAPEPSSAPPPAAARGRDVTARAGAAALRGRGPLDAAVVPLGDADGAPASAPAPLPLLLAAAVAPESAPVNDVPLDGAAALPHLLLAAERELAALGEAERCQLAIGAAEAARGEAARRLAAQKAALAAWQDDWNTAVSGLPVRAGATPPEALRVLDTLARLFTRLDESRRTARRVEGMERDARELAQRVAALAREHAPDLEGRPVEGAAAALIQRFHQARADLEKRQLLEEQLAAAEDALAEQRARAEAARGRLAALLAAAGAATVADLARAEGLSAEAKRLDRKIEMLGEQLRAAGDNASEAELSREVEALGGDPDVLTARIEELEERLAEIARERSQIDRTIGARTEGLAKLREENSAADAALELEAAVAEARALALQVARARAAALVIEREIDAYKKRHQGPILSRAAELFRALTLGSFAGLAAGYGADDQSTLRCVREGGREVDVDGLSDGTRDQLYLALRLASLERFAAHAEPLPLVLDDAFVHFDDDRARAALLALADLSSAVQVLLFTHHDRLVSIAESALPEDRRRVHRLR